MFPDVNNILDISPSCPPSGRCIVINERGTDGSFFLHHLISLYTHGNLNTCLVGVAQSYNHYKSVADKLGSSLNKRKETEAFAFIDARKQIERRILSDASDVSRVGDADIMGYQIMSTGTAAWETLDGTYLRSLYLDIKSTLQQLTRLHDASAVLLLVDDLTMLIHLGIPVVDIIHFVQYLRLLVCPTRNSNGCLAVLVHQDMSVEDYDVDVLVRQVCHGADVMLRVSGLESGFCRDVHGKVRIYFHGYIK